MKKTITKAMVLAAGFGTRLKPLTDTTPKPLLPLGKDCLIDFSLRLLANNNIREVMINLHYLGDQISTYVGNGSRYGLNVSYSQEPVILGTGGGIKKVESFFESQPFMVMNADTLITLPLQDVIAHHFASHADATMVLRAKNHDDPYNPVLIDDHGWVQGFGQGHHFYTGLQILSPSVLRHLPPAGEVSCVIQQGYIPHLACGGRVTSYIHAGYWNDVGTPERYAKAQHDLLNHIIS